jgi:hypothetical protein
MTNIASYALTLGALLELSYLIGWILSNSNLFQGSGIIGHINFDNPKHQQCTKGLAILLFVVWETYQRQCDTDAAGPAKPEECESYTTWLVIRETDDGIYRREGLLKKHVDT